MFVPFPHAGRHVRTLLKVDALPRAYLAIDIFEAPGVKCRLRCALAADVCTVDSAQADAAGIVTLGGGGSGDGGDGNGATSSDHPAAVVVGVIGCFFV